MSDRLRVSQLQAAYQEAVLENNRDRAVELIRSAMENRTPLKDVYLEVFQKTQHAVGDLWMNGRISVAQEHFCTAVTKRCMALLYPSIFAGPRIGKTLVSFTVSDELHDIGLKMVSDLMELAGWDTIYLGANMPSNGIEDVLDTYEPDLVLISVSIANHIQAARDVIGRIKASNSWYSVPILIGGNVFNTVPDLWRKTGADAYARDATEAVEVAGRLVE